MIPGLSAVHRMIFWELLRVFVLSLVGVTGIFLIGVVIQEGARFGLGPLKLLEVIPLLIPSFLPFTIPATVLFASCVAYGRLSNDNEVVALKAAGIDVLTILWPAVFLGVGAAVVVAAVSHSLIPRLQVQFQEEVVKDPEEFLYAQLKRDRTYRDRNSPYALYVRDVQGRRLIDVVIKRKSKTPKVDLALGAWDAYDYVARAPEAELRVDLDRKVLLVDARNLVASNPNSYTVVNEPKPIEIELPPLANAEELRTRPIALAWDALPARATELNAKRTEIAAKREAGLAAHARETDPVVQKRLADEDKVFVQQLKDEGRNIRNVEYQVHSRPALAVGCIAFALIGCPVGIWFNRSDYLSTFVVCWIPTVVLYYSVLLSGGNLALDGKVPMAAGVWLADAVVAVLALVLVWRLMKR